MVIFLTPLNKCSLFQRIVKPRFFGLYLYWKSRSSLLLTLFSTWGFCPHWVNFRTTALQFDSYTAPVKLPICICLQYRSICTMYIFSNIKCWINNILRYCISKEIIKVVVFHCRLTSPTYYYTFYISLQIQTRVKLNRVFFPRWSFQARSLGCNFAR